MKGYRKILIAVDGSDEVLRSGLRLASDERCWVTVLKVVPPYEGDLELVGIRDLGDVLRGGAEKAVSEINGAAKAEGALIKTRLEEGPVHERIAEVAREERCDLIVMGKSRKKGLARLLAGNLLSKVSGIAPCPVLVVGT
jgi:nucleotide-binding universal stress UspA family protein